MNAFARVFFLVAAFTAALTAETWREHLRGPAHIKVKAESPENCKDVFQGLIIKRPGGRRLLALPPTKLIKTCI